MGGFLHDGLDDATVRACVRRHVPDLSDCVAIRPCRTGKFNTSFYVEIPGAPLVIRIAPPPDTELLFYERNMMAQEPELHSLLRERTSVPVPGIIAYDTGHDVVDRDFLLMECLPGRSLTEAGGVSERFVNQVFRQVGVCLAEVHALRAGQYGYLGAHRCMEPQPTWWRAFRVMWNSLIADNLRCGGYSEEEASRLRRALERYRPAFDRDVPASLLHMDIWHQNILVDDAGRVTGVLDWDRALWGDPEIEFAVLDYCGVSVPEFWEGYGRARPETPEAAIRQRFYLLYEVQKYILISLGRRRSRAQAETYRQNVFRLAAPLMAG